MIGLDPRPGERAAGRLDPYNIPKVEIYSIDGQPSVWALDPALLPKGLKSKKGKTSESNHGNALARSAPGGFAVESVRRVAVVSFKVLRRLRFPDDGEVSPEVDVAARAVLGALAIAGDRIRLL